MPASHDRKQISLYMTRKYLADGLLDMAANQAASFDDLDHKLALGVVLRQQGKYQAALHHFERLVVDYPDNAQARTYLGMMYLSLGHWAEGWSQYQSRWRTSGWERMRYPEAHLWNGNIKDGLKILVWHEQGFGDLFQFARFISWFHERNINIFMDAPESCRKLLQSAFPGIVFLKRSETVAVDAHIPIMSIPTHIADFSPGLYNKPYIAVRNNKRIIDEQYRIGLVWRGRPTHCDDNNRSLCASVLKPLGFLPKVHWVTIQQDQALPDNFKSVSRVFYDDFYDTAQCINSLDLLITVDTAVAHLAGAMGKPVWLLLPTICDWRWGIAGDQTAWYPSIRVFRCAVNLGWDRLIVAVAKELGDELERKDE